MWSDVNIKHGLQQGSIRIEPWDEQSLQPASVDLRLGTVFYRFKENLFLSTLDVRESVRGEMIRFEVKPEEGLVIRPQGFLLGSTQEKISLDHTVLARIEGKSSLARLGLTIHSTAGFVDPGNTDLNLTLEIVNHSPVSFRIYPGMWIAQLSFDSLKTPCENPYGPGRGSRYYADSEPMPSKINEKLGLKEK